MFSSLNDEPSHQQLVVYHFLTTHAFSQILAVKLIGSVQCLTVED